jgi:hypothetical protein
VILRTTRGRWRSCFSDWRLEGEDLTISKIAWAEDSRSEVQERDVRNLMATGYDEDYLEHWLKELNLFQFAEDWLS